MLRNLSALLFALGPLWTSAQTVFSFAPDVAVQRNGSPLAMAWAGGLNSPQFSPIDLDQDGKQDLFVFDRSGNKPIFLLNTGEADQIDYAPTHVYDNVYPFPLLHDWALLRDYNCDGKADIFAYTNGAFAVYRNTSDGNGLSFTLTDDMVGSNYVPFISPNLFITSADIAGIVDVDGDGDLDIVTFSIWGPNYLEYHKNLSMEEYGTCDSLIYEVRSRCWGSFIESPESNSLMLNVPCDDNVPDPEMPTHIGTEGIHMEDAQRAHSGSTVLPLDLDGDGDMDLLLGDYSSPDLMALTNGGSVSHALMVAVDTLFPVYDQQAYFDQFLAPFHVDVDNDGKRDLIVAPNATSLSENAHGIWYYHNTGTDATPIFHYLQNDLFQGSMLEFGEGAYPVLFDHNGDGRMDLVVGNAGYYQAGGNYLGRLALLENIGTATQPAFNEITDNYLDLDTTSIGPDPYPAFGDVDGDSRPDMILGDLEGNLHFFHNTSTNSTAQFQSPQQLVSDDLGDTIDVGQDATPQLYDVDADGLLDLLVGERNGNINYYRNTGTSLSPNWHLQNTGLGGVLVNEYWSFTGFSVPFMYENEQGQKEFLSGSESGWIHHYDGIDGNIDGNWNLTDSIWEGFHEGLRTSVVLYDLNGDGHLDAVIGNYRGGLSFWRDDTYAGIQDEGVAPAQEVFSIVPNPSADEANILLHTPLRPDMHISMHDDMGRLVQTQAVISAGTRLYVGDLPNGVYTVQLVSGVTSWTQRTVIMH
jgi:hypothetical protein